MALQQDSTGIPTSLGVAELAFGFRHGRTRLVTSMVRPPFVVQRAFYLDSVHEDMAFVFLANPTAGIFQGDTQQISVAVGPAARAHVTNQSATKIHAMPEGSAWQETELLIENDGYLEYLPEPMIPFKGARFGQRTRITVASTGSLLYGEILAPGRLARGEALEYERVETRLTICRPDGVPIHHESYRMTPRSRSPLSPAILGADEAPALGSLLVVTQGVDVQKAADRLRETALAEMGANPEIRVGVTRLPGDSGVAVKALGPETRGVQSVVMELASEARRMLIGAALPPSRKY